MRSFRSFATSLDSTIKSLAPGFAATFRASTRADKSVGKVEDLEARRDEVESADRCAQ